MIIAVDGPAASGKGTIARALSRHYGLPHLDTGLIYRAVGVSVVRAGADPADPDAAFAGAGFPESLLDDPELRGEAAGRAASLASAHPAVRAALIQRQRDFAGQAGGAILDGRDIGTVICPDADAKLFVTASSQVRAERRHAEMVRMGQDNGFDAVMADILARDERDSARAAAPLRMPDDAYLLDTTDLGIAEAVAAAIAAVEARIS